MDDRTWMKAQLCRCLLLLCFSLRALGQRDCSGVDCPILDHCIEEVLQPGACCATCQVQGCTCEGYQYYDCFNAGFKNGKVPQGESYLVDFGSTECTCPEGGGKIGCRFIPCPDVPSNCIELSQRTDGCSQCERFGCIHDNQKFEAGHSFRMEPCTVCHCPNDGGDLMCSLIPNCDAQAGNKPTTMVASTTEDNTEKNLNDLYINRQRGTTDSLSRDHQRMSINSLPLYNEETTNYADNEDYDYSPEPTETATQDVARPPDTVVTPRSRHEIPDPHDVTPRNIVKELRERVSTYRSETRKEEIANSPSPMDHTTRRVQEGMTNLTNQDVPEHTPREINEGQSRRHADTQLQDPLRDITHVESSEKQERRTIKHQTFGDQLSTRSGDQDNRGEHPSHQSPLKTSAPPKLRFSSTQRPPINVREDGGQSKHRQSQTLFNYQQEPKEEKVDLHPQSAVSFKRLVEVCCEAGEKWASAQDHCNNMVAAAPDPHSICWMAQRQCCLGSLRESKCFAGVNAARQGLKCGLEDNNGCASDSYKECCSCCSLGLRFRGNGDSCEAHQVLAFPCSHVFLTCCDGGGGANHSLPHHRPKSGPLAPPSRVSDSPFPKEAFSIGDAEDSENAVGVSNFPGDIDECLEHYGKLCHQRCINTVGSYKCECYSGYILHPDGQQCVPETPDENTLSEHDVPAARPPTPSVIPRMQTPTPPNPCEGNGPCKQRCTPVDGRPQCSCFPGFSLQPDGFSCEDVDECLLATHTCQLNERCVNTLGRFTCERPVVCPDGYQERNGVCEDVDECALLTHNCGAGFECQNSAGSFGCRPKPRCSPGYAMDAQGHCVDVDECASVAQPCTQGFNCINTVGSYTCQRKIIRCSRGYHASPDGTRCIDVDECETSAHHCGEGQICQNVPGTYRCECLSGYQYDSFRRMCVDVNECWRYPGRLCAQTCENTPGSYQCSCTKGFALTSDGKNCDDVNECAGQPCSQECTNMYGSYQCYCRQGYYLREDGHTCQDIDECMQTINHLCAFKCVNVPGSYQCACPEHGFSMAPNGRSCRDVDECSLGAHNCSAGESCYNIHGSFRCLAFTCPQNYRKVSDTRCERISCPNFVDCQNSPLRITYYQLSFQTNIIIPAQIFRIGPSPAFSGDNVIISITKGNEENNFSTRKLNSYTGAVYLHRQMREPRDFLIDVEMKLWRQGTFTTFLAKIYVFITSNVP